MYTAYTIYKHTPLVMSYIFSIVWGCYSTDLLDQAKVRKLFQITEWGFALQVAGEFLKCTSFLKNFFLKNIYIVGVVPTGYFQREKQNP